MRPLLATSRLTEMPDFFLNSSNWGRVPAADPVCGIDGDVSPPLSATGRGEHDGGDGQRGPGNGACHIALRVRSTQMTTTFGSCRVGIEGAGIRADQIRSRIKTANSVTEATTWVAPAASNCAAPCAPVSVPATIRAPAARPLAIFDAAKTLFSGGKSCAAILFSPGVAAAGLPS